MKPFRFKRRANRLCIWLEGKWTVPLAVAGLDEYPVFETAPPRRHGDDAIVRVDGQRVLVRRLGHYIFALGRMGRPKTKKTPSSPAKGQRAR